MMPCPASVFGCVKAAVASMWSIIGRLESNVGTPSVKHRTDAQEARKRARKTLVAVNEGRDPTAEKDTKGAASGLIFVGQGYLSGSPPSAETEDAYRIRPSPRGAWKPLHKLAVGAVSSRSSVAHLRLIAKGSGPVAANNARGTRVRCLHGPSGKGCVRRIRSSAPMATRVSRATGCCLMRSWLPSGMPRPTPTMGDR